MHHPFLVGRNLYLRGLEAADLAGPYFQWFNDAVVCAHNGHALFPNSEKAMQAYFEQTQDSRREAVFAVVLKKGDRHVGNVALQNIDWIGRSAAFSILLGEASAQGRGLGTEAALLVRDYAFTRLNLRRLYCGTLDTNTAMQKLALALGMKLEGRRRQAQFKNGAYHDVLEYGLVRKD